MPIRESQRALYPANWRDIATAVKERAGFKCEGSPAYPDCRAAHGAPHPVTGSRVVLTCAHLDHHPANCAPENLRAWCQRCHLTYDLPIHLHNRRMNAARRAGQAAIEAFIVEGADRAALAVGKTTNPQPLKGSFSDQ